MKKVSGFRFQVSGRQNNRVIVFLVLFLTGFWIPGSGQELSYSFKQGEVLGYELIESMTDHLSSDTLKTIWKYRFTVMSAGEDHYVMKMELNCLYNDFINFSFTDQTVLIPPKLRSNITIVQVYNSIINAEINNPITFTMDSRGGILSMQGDEEIRAAIFKAAEGEPAIKSLQNYNWIKVYYGSQKYKYLIQEFFPAIHGAKADTVTVESENSLASRINIWPIGPIQPDSLGKILLKRAFVFKFENSTSRHISAKNTVNDMVISWPITSGYPLHIQYRGYIPEVLFNNISVNDRDDPEIQRIEIINTSRSSNKTSKVSIVGSISNLGNKELTATLPGSGISREDVAIKPDQNGQFTLDFDLDISAGLVGLKVSPADTNFIRLFVKPGDSLSFSVDLNNRKTLEFSGSNSREQQVLNQLLSNNVPARPVRSIQNVRSNMQYLDQQSHVLDEGFLKFMEIENKYTLYTHQLDEIWRAKMFQSKRACDSLPKFRKYLGNPDGYKYDAYKVFINYLIYAYMYEIDVANGEYFDLAPAILTGWDLYYYRATRAERSLSVKPPFFDDRLYFMFSDLYPGTEFQHILNEKYDKLTQNGRVGTMLPDFNFRDVAGKTYSIRDLKGKYWCILFAGDNDGYTKQIISQGEKYNREHPDPLTFFIWSKNDSVREFVRTKITGDHMILLAGSDKNQALAEYFGEQDGDILVIDPTGRIATYGIENHSNLVSWPVSKISKEQTINLRVLWYSLAGALILSLIIILTIRIRSKRREARMNLKRKIARLEVDAVRSRMNPHFLFNALGSIQNLVNRGKNQEASQYLARFGDMVRTILTQSSKPVIGLNEEIDMIRNYLLLEQLGSPFVFDIQVNPAIDPATIEIPPLLIQPHVENAVIHGISSLGEAGKISINFRLEDECLICEVIDNGPGYHPGSNPAKEGLGQGWKLTRQRIELMKELYGEEVSAVVSDGTSGDNEPDGKVGTKVTFKLPLQKSSI